MPLRCQMDCQVVLKKKKKTDKTKEKHNLDNKIKWKLKEQRIKNTKQKQRNKKNQTGKQAKIYLLKKIGLTLMASTSILNTTAATPL